MPDASALYHARFFNQSEIAGMHEVLESGYECCRDKGSIDLNLDALRALMVDPDRDADCVKAAVVLAAFRILAEDDQ